MEVNLRFLARPRMPWEVGQRLPPGSACREPVWRRGLPVSHHYTASIRRPYPHKPTAVASRRPTGRTRRFVAPASRDPLLAGATAGLATRGDRYRVIPPFGQFTRQSDAEGTTRRCLQGRDDLASVLCTPHHNTGPTVHGTNSSSPRPSCSLLVFLPLATARISVKISRPTSVTGRPVRMPPASRSMSSRIRL